MEESPENSAIERQQQSLPEMPEGEQGEQIVEQPQSMQISEELRIKFTKTLQSFSQHMKAFRQGQHNSFRIENPHEYELYQIMRIWQSRPCRNQKFLLHLELEEPKLPLELVKQTFERLPSIMVIYAGTKIENNAILQTDGDFFYEGNEKFMNIFSEARETDYHGEVMNRMMHGQGVLVSRAKKGGFVYKGSFFEGKYHGTGELRTSKNVTYVGEFKDDFKHGRGVEMIMKRKKNPAKGEPAFIKKSMYNGEFREGFRCGEGMEETPHGVYRGEWRDNVKCGHGEIEYRNGDKYQGEWFNGEFHGEGTYMEKGNCTYTGSFQEGKYHGQGVMEYNNGDKYEGQFQKGKKHGQGIYTWADGDYYDGQWKNDSADGTGTSMLGTDFYDGQYKNGKRHGLGELTNEEGDVIKAMWENNEIIKQLQFNGEPVE